MIWNKTPQEIVDKILEHLRADYSKRYIDIAEMFGVSEWLVSELARKLLTKEERVARYSAINKYAKLKSNPMTGKTKTKHHRAKDVVIVAGYKTEWAPDWWTGLNPKGKVVHHKDEDKFNNDPSNLVCITRREHAQIHCVSNILKRCNDYPQGVESSALEAQRVLYKEDRDIV